VWYLQCYYIIYIILSAINGYEDELNMNNTCTQTGVPLYTLVRNENLEAVFWDVTLAV
jgi:hypothetical protein